ncbi:MAG: DJ-1/PfpI family protein [Devosiaceae bacterium]|nr:DJ-1/PfpI family protein [Devosiaceae bacterium MH13]
MRKLCALIFPGFELLDLFGPLEMFGLLRGEFELSLIAEEPGPVRSNQGVCAHADESYLAAPAPDVLLIPGGKGTRTEVRNERLLAWIGETADRAEYVLTVCTGSALLAKTGQLDDRQATTNKLAFDWVASQGPKVHWQREARWVEDGRFITSSGVSAGMDMALGAIALMHGREVAEKVALWSEYHWNDDPTLDPFARRAGLV